MGFGIQKPRGEAGSAWPSIMVGMFAAFAGVLYGFDTGESLRALLTVVVLVRTHLQRGIQLLRT